MALTFNTYQPPSKSYTMLTANVDGTDALLIRRPYNMIGQGKWRFTHSAASSDPAFTLEASFATFINATPGWATVTSTGNEIPEMASAIRIKSAAGDFGGIFSCICEGDVDTYATTQSTVFTPQASVQLSLANNPVHNGHMTIDSPGDFLDHVVTIVSSDTTKATVSNISRSNFLVGYTITPLAVGSTTLTFTLTPLATGTALTAVTRTVTVVA